jgi:hypothetical protein
MVMSSSITVAKKPRRRNKVRSRRYALAPHRRPRIPGYTRKTVATGALFRKNSGLPRHTLSIRHRMRGDPESRHPSSRTGNHRRTTRPGRGTQRSTLHRRTPAIPGLGATGRRPSCGPRPSRPTPQRESRLRRIGPPPCRKIQESIGQLTFDNTTAAVYSHIIK